MNRAILGGLVMALSHVNVDARQYGSRWRSRTATLSRAISLNWIERGALLAGIIEIPLQIDKYFMYHQRDAELGAVAGLNVSMTTIALVVLYALWIGDAALHRERTVGRLFLGLPMLLYLFAVAFSVLAAMVPMLALCELWLLAQAYLLFFYIANRVQTKFDLLFCLTAVACSLTIESIIIIGSQAIGLDDERLEIGPLTITAWEGQRQGGTMQSPVLAGSTMALMWLPIAGSLTFLRSKIAWRIAFVVTAFGMLAILLTQTRGAILTSVVGSAIIGFGLFRRQWLPSWSIPLATMLVVLSIPLLVIVYQKRIQEGDNDSAIARKHLSLIALEMISREPVFGYGAGNCHLAGEKIASQSNYRAEWYYTIHCKYLLVWIETGLVGMIGFMMMLGNGLRQAWRSWLDGKDRMLSILGLALVAALLGHMLHLAVDIFNSRIQVQTLWLMLGLCAAVWRMVNIKQLVSPEDSKGSNPSVLHGGVS